MLKAPWECPEVKGKDKWGLMTAAIPSSWMEVNAMWKMVWEKATARTERLLRVVGTAVFPVLLMPHHPSYPFPFSLSL